jgi:hypothetical protein
MAATENGRGMSGRAGPSVWFTRSPMGAGRSIALLERESELAAIDAAAAEARRGVGQVVLVLEAAGIG